MTNKCFLDQIFNAGDFIKLFDICALVGFTILLSCIKIHSSKLEDTQITYANRLYSLVFAQMQ